MNYNHIDIEKETKENNEFRKILYTGKLQLVLMSLDLGQEIGEEIHGVDQFFRIEEGTAKFIINGKEIIVNYNEIIIIPSNTKHNVVNIGSNKLKLYTIYSPPQHHVGGNNFKYKYLKYKHKYNKLKKETQ